MAIEEGKAAPAFTLKDKNGDKISLRDLRGKNVVVYFYPRDDTPGCTKEACGFRDLWKKIQKLNTVVLGISPDSEASHQKFSNKYKLPFTLLSDPDHAMAEAFGAWGTKKNYGKEYQGIIRSTFAIDAEGIVEHAWYNVRAAGHVDRVGSEVLGSST